MLSIARQQMNCIQAYQARPYHEETILDGEGGPLKGIVCAKRNVVIEVSNDF